MVAAATAAVLLASCGARVGPYLGADGAGQLGGTATTVAGASGATATGASAVGGAAAGSAPAGSGTGGSGAAPATGAPAAAAGTAATPAAASAPVAVAPQTFNFVPSAEAADCRGGAGNTASAPGVTPTQVTIGNVSGETGPLSGSFSQGGQAVQALFSAINAAGGICGRTLSLDEEDDQQNASNNAADVQDLAPKVLAFAGSTSDADNGGVPFMEQGSIPDFGFAINCNRSESPDYWSAAGGSCQQVNGRYYINNSVFAQAKQFGYFPTKMAFLAYNIAISAQAAQEYAYVYQHMGGSVCYTDFSISPATASLESDVEQMQAAGCNGVITTMDVTGNAKLLQAMQQQSFTMPYVATTFDGYTPDQITDAGESAAQGLIVGIPFIPLNEPQPMVEMYQQQLATYEPGAQPSGFGFLSWEAAQMLVYCLIESGHNPTRATITHDVAALQNWDGGGALGPYTPSTHGLGSCNVDVVVHGTSFVRKDPSSGLFCGGQLVPASS